MKNTFKVHKRANTQIELKDIQELETMALNTAKNNLYKKKHIPLVVELIAATDDYLNSKK